MKFLHTRSSGFIPLAVIILFLASMFPLQSIASKGETQASRTPPLMTNISAINLVGNTPVP